MNTPQTQLIQKSEKLVVLKKRVWNHDINFKIWLDADYEPSISIQYYNFEDFDQTVSLDVEFSRSWWKSPNTRVAFEKLFKILKWENIEIQELEIQNIDTQSRKSDMNPDNSIEIKQGDNNSIIVTFKWINNSDKESSFSFRITTLENEALYWNEHVLWVTKVALVWVFNIQTAMKRDNKEDNYQ